MKYTRRAALSAAGGTLASVFAPTRKAIRGGSSQITGSTIANFETIKSPLYDFSEFQKEFEQVVAPVAWSSFVAKDAEFRRAVGQVKSIKRHRTIVVSPSGIVTYSTEGQVDKKESSRVEVPVEDGLEAAKGQVNYVVVFVRVGQSWQILSQTGILDEENNPVTLSEVSADWVDRISTNTQRISAENGSASKQTSIQRGSLQLSYNLSHSEYQYKPIQVSVERPLLEYHSALEQGTRGYIRTYSLATESDFISELGMKLAAARKRLFSNDEGKMTHTDIAILAGLSQNYKIDKWPPENPKLPQESVFSFADCEDMAILSAALIEEMTEYSAGIVSFPGHIEVCFAGPGDELTVYKSREVTIDGTTYRFPFGKDYNADTSKGESVIAVGTESGWMPATYRPDNLFSIGKNTLGTLLN